MATEMLGGQKTMAQELACLLRMMVASHPAILPAPLYYRLLERPRLELSRKAFHTSKAEVQIYRSQLKIRPTVLDNLSWSLQWGDITDHSLGIGYQIGCSQEKAAWEPVIKGMWPMDGSGKDTIKITSGYWLPFLALRAYFQQEGNVHSTPPGQCDSHCLYEQDGRGKHSTP